MVSPSSGGRAASRGNRPTAERRRGAISFAGQLQRVRCPDEALLLAEQAPSPAAAAAALERLGQLVPLADGRAAEAAAVRSDARLARTVSRLAEHPPPPSQRCAVLWALALVFPRGSEVPGIIPQVTAELASSLPDDLAPTLAAHALWGCDTIGVSAPAPLLAAASRLPFRLHVGIASAALGGSGPAACAAAVAEMVAELPIQRDVISSGSVRPDAQAVVEDRETCWLSDSGAAFSYSGKVMPSQGALTPSIAAVRDSVSASLSRHFCSVLVNHYPDETSGMRFHSDPGQGPEGGWGYDTAVVSVGQTRLFTFRRPDSPATRATFAVRHGDVLHMFGDCQEHWQHSVVRDRPGLGRSAAPPSSRPDGAASNTKGGPRRAPRAEHFPYAPQPPPRAPNLARRAQAATAAVSGGRGTRSTTAIHSADRGGCREERRRGRGSGDMGAKDALMGVYRDAPGSGDGYGGRVSLVFKRTWELETQLRPAELHGENSE